MTTFRLTSLEGKYALTDRVQIGVMAGFGATEQGPGVARATLKVGIGRGTFAHVAALMDTFVIVGGSRTLRFAGVGPILTVCFDDGCESVLSLAVLVGYVMARPDELPPYDGLRVLGSPSLVVALARRLKLVGEIHRWHGHTDGVELHQFAGDIAALSWIAAVRVPWDRLAIEGGVANGRHPIGSVVWRWD